MWLPARTAAPQPPKTSTKVPISSATYFFIPCFAFEGIGRWTIRLPHNVYQLSFPGRITESRLAQGILGIEGKLPAPGSFEVKPPVALLAAHDARMSVACCTTYPFSRSVAPGSGRFVLPANDEAAIDITAGSLNADGPTEAAFGK